MSVNTDLWLHAGLFLALGVTAGSLAVGLWGGYMYRPGRPSREIARRAYWFSLFATVVLLPTAVFFDPTLLQDHTLGYSLWPLAVAPLIGLAVLMQDFRRRYFIACLVLCLGVATSLWMLGR